MSYIELSFKLVSIIFACASVFTGAQALIDPIGFSNSFGLPIGRSRTTANDAAGSTKATTTSPQPHPSTTSYVSLMGVRQLATGLIITVFAWQNKWSEIATILSIIGLLVAGTDGYHLSSTGEKGLGIFHALPGASIAALASAKLWFQH